MKKTFVTQRTVFMSQVLEVKRTEIYKTACGGSRLPEDEETWDPSDSTSGNMSFLSFFVGRIKKGLEKIPHEGRDTAKKCYRTLSGVMSSHPEKYPKWSLPKNLTNALQDATNFLETVSTQLQEEKVDIVALQHKHTILMDHTMELSSTTFTRLVKQVNSVRRPYLRESLQLVMACRLLWHQKTSSQDDLAAIKETFDETFATLESAATVTLDRLEILAHDVETSEVRRSLDRARNKIRDCFGTLRLQNWAESEADIVKGLKADRTRMTEFKTFLEKISHQVSPEANAGELIQVTVDVYLKDSPLGKRTMSVKPNARLFSIVWEITEEIKASGRAKYAESHNVNLHDRDSELSADRLVSSLPVHTDEKRYLKVSLDANV
ncbi:uncharacterized protein STEHIDRAFT_116172 [Stereum hirsutum FP-91666 SS1]|uniref:Uncharacterized protein n=1 Tax=Stereum hirsutum (strain FP-91666) TaxID=721885 RepID=R7RXA4_STEHR|nr:uncharacterized protein STEHIDRAFT_116172 [Stereum hirsutum FP-91666 SS1]EIM79979.1 hypothetical protein STEHIDRAFT_116172 [Stereum hirsutum FP-91666 SS1]